MIKRQVWLIAGFAVIAGCTEPLGPGISGRWAAPGIELQASNGVVDLRMPCVHPFRAPRLVILTADSIEFGGRVNELWYKYDFAFRGQFVGDTLFATLVRSGPDSDPLVSNHKMTRDGDSELGRQICLA